MNYRTYGYVYWVCVLILDQISKYFIVHEIMQPPMPQAVTSFFNIVLVWNKGTSFNIIAHSAAFMPYLLSVLSLGICIWLHRWLRRSETRLHAAALGLIIGGAIGNVFDRLLYGAVVDFLDFHINTLHWPAFNVADSAIVIGVAMLVLGGRDKTA